MWIINFLFIIECSAKQLGVYILIMIVGGKFVDFMIHVYIMIEAFYQVAGTVAQTLFDMFKNADRS